ncbi:MAG: RluA family pseudouridine synthase [Clostridia bacterium]|nr:RluA family pseudouridine synthase [Clostridia bacterium]
MRILTVRKNDAGQRLDKFLTKAVKGLPMSLMYKYIRTKKIKVNRTRAEQSQILCEGDEVQLFIKEEFFDVPSKDTGALSAITPKLDIVYEDEHILLLNKRPGVLVHDDAEGGENTLILHVQAYLTGKGEYDPENEQSFAPALCNRIDRNTGGMVIAAKDAEALRVMNRLIREDELSKFYLCLAHGRMEMPRAELRGWLRKDSADNLVRVENREFPGSKEIITRYRVVDEGTLDGEPVSLLEIELVTGRTHQIRAHLAHIGHPLIGDGKYGVNRDDKKSGFKFQALYAYRLRFDVKGEGECLSYLRGKEFRIPADRIWFTEDFDLTALGREDGSPLPVYRAKAPAGRTAGPAQSRPTGTRPAGGKPTGSKPAGRKDGRK